MVRLPEATPGPVLADLYDRGVRSVLVEGGGEMLAAFAESGLWDRAAVDCAPLLIGGRSAPGPLAGEGARRLADAAKLEGLRPRRHGADLVLTGERAGLVAELLGRVL